jgi:hypothetical protein
MNARLASPTTSSYAPYFGIAPSLGLYPTLNLLLCVHGSLLIGLFLHNIGGSPHFGPFVGKGARRTLQGGMSMKIKNLLCPNKFVFFAEEQY